MDDSKLRWVLVLVSENRVSRIFPLGRSEPFSETGIMSVSVLRMKSSFSLSKFLIDIMSLPLRGDASTRRHTFASMTKCS